MRSQTMGLMLSVAVNRRYHTMFKRKIKRQAMTDTTLHRKLTIDQHDG